MGHAKYAVKTLLFSAVPAASVYLSFGDVQAVRAAASPEMN